MVNPLILFNARLTFSSIVQGCLPVPSKVLVLKIVFVIEIEVLFGIWVDICYYCSYYLSFWTQALRNA